MCVCVCVHVDVFLCMFMCVGVGVCGWRGLIFVRFDKIDGYNFENVLRITLESARPILYP